jgi:peptidyl-prolyl cis-trans isomerase B (cyclophilin B)
MARTRDPNSASAQFFINVKDNDNLNRAPRPGGEGYAVFGRVIDGMDVVDKIRKVKTGPKGMFREDCPQEDVVIKSVTVEEKPGVKSDVAP